MKADRGGLLALSDRQSLVNFLRPKHFNCPGPSFLIKVQNARFIGWYFFGFWVDRLGRLMLRYQGKAIAFDSKGTPLPEQGYDLQAEVLDAVDGRIRFGQEKRPSNGFAVSGEFEFDLQGRPAQFPEKGISVVYINKNECFGAMSIQGTSYSLAAKVDFSLIRNVLFNPEVIHVETLTPRISDVEDLSPEERLVCDFVREKALKILDVRSIILFGSRSVRSHHSESDFDFAIDAVGKRSDWLALADCVRNEAPTLREIQVVELSHRLKWGFVASVYRNGRFIYG